MNPLKTDLPVVHLKPGEVYYSEKPELVYTLLGSCVSITMYNPRYKMAAMCHALLPEENKGKGEGQREDNSRYLDQAFRAMYDWYVRRGVKKEEIEIKVFGGGDVIPLESDEGRPGGKTVGARNIEAAVRLVLEKGLRITAIDGGGETGRKLYFYTHSGEVLMKRMKKNSIPAAVKDK